MSQGKSKTPLCLVCTIVERGTGQKVAMAYKRQGLELHYRVSGEGTASSDLLDILGIGTSERDILISPAPRRMAERLVEKIHQEGIGVRAKGIMCMMPLTAASTKVASLLLQHADTAAEEEDMMENKKTIEQNFEEIETIIENMQKEDVTLEKSFELYHQGLKLVKDCNSQIDHIEKQIQIINEEQDEKGYDGFQ